MLGNDEKKFLELRAKFETELESIRLQISQLTDRQNELVGLMDGYVDEEETETMTPMDAEAITYDRDTLDEELVKYIKSQGKVPRSEITIFFSEQQVDPDDVRLALARCKHRGLIKVNGKAKSAVWSVVK